MHSCYVSHVDEGAGSDVGWDFLRGAGEHVPDRFQGLVKF